MRVSVQIEFTDDEILKHAEDVGRRWTLNAIHDGLGHLRGIDPALFRIAADAFARAVVDVTRTNWPSGAEQAWQQAAQQADTPPDGQPPSDGSPPSPVTDPTGLA